MTESVVIDDHPVRPDLQVINDDQLLALLKEAGAPAGIACIGGGRTVVFHDDAAPQ